MYALVGNITGLYYNNDIECMHYLEIVEQCFKRGSLETVLTNLKSLLIANIARK